MSDWLIILLLIILLLIVINVLNKRSEGFAEEIRQKKVIENLPITENDVRKLFAKTKKKNGSRGLSKNSSIDFSNFDEFSPLKLLGYTVGASGLPTNERIEVLNFAIFGNFQNYMPNNLNYDLRWGVPGSKQRFSQVYSHIRRVKNLRNTRVSMGKARRDWAMDMMYIREEQKKIYQFRLIKPL